VSRVQQGETVDIYVTALDSAGAGETGATIDLSIRREDDNTFWNGTIWTTYTTVTMTEVDATNLPGLYSYNLSAAPSADTVLYILATTADADVDNFPREESITVGGWADELDAPISVVDSNVDDILVDTTALNDTKLTTARANNLDNLDTTVSSRSDFDETADNVTVSAMAQSAVDDLFSVDSSNTYAGAVAGSVVKEIADNTSGGGGSVDLTMLEEDVADVLTAVNTFSTTLRTFGLTQLDEEIRRMRIILEDASRKINGNRSL